MMRIGITESVLPTVPTRFVVLWARGLWGVCSNGAASALQSPLLAPCASSAHARSCQLHQHALWLRGGCSATGVLPCAVPRATLHRRTLLVVEESDSHPPACSFSPLLLYPTSTGDEPQVMMDAHVEAGFVVGIPFAAKGAYDFGAHGGMTARVQQLGSVMLKHRLTPPPEEAYSLHRKLSGAFLACMKLRARVPCRELLHQVLQRHQLAAAGGSDQQAAGRMAVSAAPLHDKHDERQERRQSSSESSGRVVAAIIA